MSVLLLRLSGPMQSWGDSSRFTERDTRREPTKSGVIGLICAALGKPREEEPDHVNMWPTLVELAALKMAVRADREGTLRKDFHTAGGGKWPGRDSYGVAKASGASPDTVISNRYYLADAVFLAALEGDRALLERIQSAIARPVWPLFLGRKSFVPGEPVLTKDGLLNNATPVGALSGWPWLVSLAQRRRDERPERLRLVVECDAGEDGEPRQDVPLSFASSVRSFAVRRVREMWIDTPAPREEVARVSE
jgi:CRISPR system Cascade subunit CasD